MYEVLANLVSALFFCHVLVLFKSILTDYKRFSIQFGMILSLPKSSFRQTFEFPKNDRTRTLCGCMT